MMKKLITFFAGFCLTVAILGCAQTRFCHPNKTAADFERDKYDCELIAIQKAHDFGAAGNPFIIGDEMKRCLQYKHGWKPCQ